MTIEEVEYLRIQELNGQLRVPNLNLNDSQIQNLALIGLNIYNIINNKFFPDRMLNKISLRKMGVEISGKGTIKEPYVINTQFGDGEFFHIKYILGKNKNAFEVGQCFFNALTLSGAMTNVNNVKQSVCVSGLTILEKSGQKCGMLHSVVELNDDMIADVNLGLVMSKNLYKTIFMFEELTRIDGEKFLDLMKILDNQKAIQTTQKFNLRSYHMAFALEDLVDFVMSEERQNGHETFANLEY